MTKSFCVAGVEWNSWHDKCRLAVLPTRPLRVLDEQQCSLTLTSERFRLSIAPLRDAEFEAPMIRHSFLLILLTALSIAGTTSTAAAWESFGPPLTLSQRVAQSDTVVFGECLNSVEPATKGGVRDGRFRILHVAKTSEAIEKGKIVVAAGVGNWKVGEHAMLTLFKKQSEDFWKVSLVISRACFDYALAVPNPEQDAEKRAPYFLRHLNPITDKGVAQLDGLTKLTSLYLGETKVTDVGLKSLAKMTKLQKLWLNGTAVSDAAIPLLAGLKSLRELHVEKSQLSAAGVLELRKRLPTCEILDGR